MDHSIDCSYAHKAVNVQKKGGRLMLIASDSNILEEEYNVDDPTESVFIPSIIIAKDFGDIIREYYKYKQKESENIVISIKFSGVKEGGYVELELFLRSDDTKARDFFSEFSYFKEKLGEKLKFIPIYKYSKFVNEQFDNIVTEKSTIPCVKKSRMCAIPNHALQIDNPRTILLENILETCVFQELGQDVYWNYMTNFNSYCFDLRIPLFNEECALSVLKKVQTSENDITIINKCMSQLIEYESKIDNDFMTFSKRKIYSIPDLYINGVPYRGSWYSKYIFRSICNGFLDDAKICEGINPSEVISSQKSVNYVLLFIIVMTIFVTVTSLLFYKTIIKSNIDIFMDRNIQETAMKNLSYKQFNDTKSPIKLELVNE